MYLTTPGGAINSGALWTASSFPWPGSAGDKGSPGLSNEQGIWGDNDSDHDALPDTWEYQQFTNGMCAQPDGDDDRDQCDNHAEWIAGTQPTNAASVFTADTVTRGPGVILQWTGASGRRYAVQWASMLTNTFTCLATNLPGVTPINQFTDTVHDTENQSFYRITVEIDE